MDETVRKMDNMTLAGVVLGLTGGLLALIPSLEALLAAPSVGWPGELLMALVAAAGITGAILGARQMPAFGGVVALVAGLVITTLGPVSAGVLVVIGGALLFVSAPEAEERPQRQEPSRAEPPRSSDVGSRW